MKSRKISIAILAVVAAAFVSAIVVSCKKEKQEQVTSNLEQGVQSSENIDEYLISFKKRMLSATKGGESISLEQAQRDFGNLLNFDFGDANYETNMYQYDTIKIKVSIAQNQIELSQLALAYNEAVKSIIETYHENNMPEKSIYCILCNFNEMQSKDGDNDGLEIVVVTRGYDNSATPVNNHDSFDWRPRNYAGTCDGQNIGTGAPEIITQWIYQSREAIACSNGVRIYFTDVDHWDTYGYLHYDSVAGRFRIYTSFNTDQNSICIPHDEMEYYYSQILSLYHQQPFGNHYIQYVVINHEYKYNTYIPALGEVRAFYTWSIRIRHGKPNCTDQPAVE